MKFIGTQAKNNAKTTYFFCIPVFKKITHEIGHGGGISYKQFEYRILNLRIYKTHQIPHLIASNQIFCNAMFKLESKDLLSKIARLVRGLGVDSKKTVFKIIERNLLYPQGSFAPPSDEEAMELAKIKSEFCVFKIDEVFCFNGYFLPIHHFETSVFWHKHSLLKLESSTLKSMKNKDIIDVGGFIGDSAIVFLEFSDRFIHTFEATRSNFALLLKTLEINKDFREVNRIIPQNLGLGAKSEKLKINLCGSGSSLINEVGSEFEECQIITLDSYASKNNIEIGFIKVDIEGFEMEFLKGAIEVIKAQKPAMLISIYHNESDFFEIKPWIEGLNLGYSFKIIKPIDAQSTNETILFCEVL